MQSAHIHLSDTLLSELSDCISEQIGLYFPKKRWADLERGLEAATRQFDQPDSLSCVRWLLSAPLSRDQIEVLSRHLTVGETYFFREKRSLDILAEQIIPSLLNARASTDRRLRFWSAGCSTGEEAYSIAMLLDRVIPRPDQWAVSILATDINPVVLRKARAGVYSAWSFRDTPDWMRTHYFARTKGDHYEIHARIREQVTFSYLNLVDDAYSSITNNTHAMDVILCRNVLMYFTPAQAKKVIDHFYDVLVEGGWLIVGAVETSLTLFSRYTAAGFPGAAIYRKCANAELPTVQPVDEQPHPAYQLDEPALPRNLLAAEALAFVDAPPDGSIDPARSVLPVADLFMVGAVQREDLAQQALLCANEGRHDEAVVWCEQAIASDKFNPVYLYLLATIQQEQGQYDSALESLMRALYLDPDFVLAHFALGNQCLQLGRHAEAERYFRNALMLLNRQPRDDLLPSSDGLTVGRLIEIITGLLPELPHRGGRYMNMSGTP